MAIQPIRQATMQHDHSSVATSSDLPNLCGCLRLGISAGSGADLPVRAGSTPAPAGEELARPAFVEGISRNALRMIS
jgi:hypothetical protein